jgi:hypothetical protein
MTTNRLTAADREYLRQTAELLPKLDRRRRHLLRTYFLTFMIAAAKWSKDDARNARRRAARASRKGGGR